MKIYNFNQKNESISFTVSDINGDLVQDSLITLTLQDISELLYSRKIESDIFVSADAGRAYFIINIILSDSYSINSYPYHFSDLFWVMIYFEDCQLLADRMYLQNVHLDDRLKSIQSINQSLQKYLSPKYTPISEEKYNLYYHQAIGCFDLSKTFKKSKDLICRNLSYIQCKTFENIIISKFDNLTNPDSYPSLITIKKEFELFLQS